MTLTVGSLFSGIGGLELGLERAGMTVRWQVEIDDYATRILTKHWPNVPKFRDVRAVGRHNLEPVDLICGGFPCQDISVAGKKAGIDGDESGLWREFARIVGELRPRFVLVENVSDLLHRGIGRVLGDLAERGYDAEWSTLSACALGAPHTRERVFIVAYPMQSGQAGRRPGGIGRGSLGQTKVRRTRRGDDAKADVQWLAEPGVGRVADGVPYGVDRINRLGNAVVPQVAEYIGRLIMRTL